MAYMFVTGDCAACGKFIDYNPHHVPSIRVEGHRKAICEDCFHRWNKIHRTDKGLEPLPLHPDAYEPAEV